MRAGGAAHRPRADADALLRGDDAADRRRGHGDRQPQPARLQRLQDDARRASRSSARQIARARRAGGARRRGGRGGQAASARSISSPTTSRRLISDWDGGDRALNVVWDTGNGAAGEVLARLIAVLPGSHHPAQRRRSTARFPAHHPDPTVPENLRAAASRRCARTKARSRHRLRRRRATASASSTTAAQSCWATS